MTVKGIDISHWQGTIEWPRIPDEYKYAFMKATEGDGFIDDMFAQNWESAEVESRSPYHFWRYHFDGTLQAEHFYDIVDATGDLGELPPVVDLEDTRAPKGGDIAARMRQMLQRTEELFGIKPIIYTANWWWNPWTLNNTGFGDYTLWVAHYKTVYPWSNPLLPAGWNDWQIWQHSSTGSVPGVQGNCDLNIAKEDWYEGFVNPPPTQYTVQVIAPKEVKVDVRHV